LGDELLIQKTIIVEILHFDGCPHTEKTRGEVATVAEALGLEVEIKTTVVENPEDATRLRYLGSPTVRLNGVDIDPTVRDQKDYRLGSRMYGRSSVPSRIMIEAALMVEGF